MTRVLVEVDGKAVYDKTFQDSQVTLSSRRDVAALYKMGQQDPYTLAPSRFVQDAILCEQGIDVNAEVTTGSKEGFVKA